MLKTRIYIIQFLGMLVLMCGYFLSDQPDSLSLMHFDPSAVSVIHKTTKSTANSIATQTLTSSQGNGRHKSNVPKHFPIELMLTLKGGYVFVPLLRTVNSISLPENYSYLFYKEINPPPPKAC